MVQTIEEDNTPVTKAEERAAEGRVAASLFSPAAALQNKHYMQQGRDSYSSSDEELLIPAARPEQPSSTEIARGHAAIASSFDNNLLQQQSHKAGLDELQVVEQSMSNPPLVKDLADVSHRLMMLEKAVKAHFMPVPRSDSSILSAFSTSINVLGNGPLQSGTASVSGAFGSPMAAKSLERGRLRDAVSQLKAEGEFSCRALGVLHVLG
jgi:hypothetical protein